MMQKLGFKKGFTLIELLVVIGVLAVIAAGVVALIDPVDKNRAAMDAKVQSDIGQIATAMQSYAARDAAGLYPPALTNLAPSELVRLPSAPSGYATYNCSGCGTATVVVCGELKSKKYASAVPAARPVWRWESSTGKICDTTGTVTPNCGAACP